MTSKWIAFLFCAIALGGCCASGSGCYAPANGIAGRLGRPRAPPDLARFRTSSPGSSRTAAGVSEDHAKKPAKTVVRPSGGATAASAAKPHSDEWWAKKEAEDRDADKALTRKLIICRGCSSSSPRTDDSGNRQRSALNDGRCRVRSVRAAIAAPMSAPAKGAGYYSSIRISELSCNLEAKTTRSRLFFVPA